MANVNRDPKKQRRPYQARDFFPSLGGKTREQTPEEQQALFLMHAKRTQGRIVRKPAN